MRGLGKGFPLVNELCTDRFFDWNEPYCLTAPAFAGVVEK